MKLPATPLDNKFRILIVEDDASIAKLVSINLKMAGFDCRIATDGNAGWAAFQSVDPHLVLSDISMPGLSGHELTAKIRAQSSVPVILMTAASSDENEMTGFKSGADDYVAKPFNPKLLVTRVVANLRRVYRYDAPAAPVKAVPPPPDPNDEKSLPHGWSRCDACDYMGPQNRFNGEDINGNPIFVCPNCKSRTVTFSVG
jgi:DNA-binding response OmpR family regulator